MAARAAFEVCLVALGSEGYLKYRSGFSTAEESEIHPHCLGFQAVFADSDTVSERFRLSQNGTASYRHQYITVPRRCSCRNRVGTEARGGKWLKVGY